MRVVGIAIITALLSAGCAIQPGDPSSEDMQHPNGLVGVSAGEEQPGVNAHPQVPPRSQSSPTEKSPNPSPWNGGGDSHTSGGNPNGGNDNPNPSPWGGNPTGGPHAGGVGIGGGTGG
jgi:hypothetical protein